MPAWALHQYSVYLARRDGVVIDAIKWPNGRDAAVPAGHRYGAAQLMPVGPRAVRCLVARVQDAVRTCTLAKAHLNQGLKYGTLTLGHVMSLLTSQPKLGSEFSAHISLSIQAANVCLYGVLHLLYVLISMVRL